ncbi:FRAS1-related extracellular matrix protein 1a isoform X1 [Hypanus sabinus]|uniref:FRAS1-related extracellular matrix protein 1a isoform X1 n=1 Tax=Hypanus sabinus TaxID=79690 RepID=UPI0028C3EC4E|nr:FRAS1-related extracellular matrix protein 1a isoform X1 [Hypanus sabinus]XP_059830669.1 FRAS1-related extracellular matrix protein 1a isoform X1 [Hypanus sabinus]XP_059830670.1 FRAS1-related extracellular matrix protein 1a isoform X1 [Hypanus sabinus]XP_059830671.1 FRAS1-related extracellular matrix protein 1a isoform X1 [Hypanus sabinus]
MKQHCIESPILLQLIVWRCIAPSLVQVNHGITVPKGQSVFLSEKNLVFNIPKEKDSCKVEVVMNEPITQRVGKLTPQVFDCHFLPNEVRYSHNGCPILDEDQILLRVYRFTENETYTETFTLQVRLLDSDCNIIHLGATSLEVPEFYSLSNPIDRNVVLFDFDKSMNLDCIVRVATQETLLPAHGHLVMGKISVGQARGDHPGFVNQKLKWNLEESHKDLKEVHTFKVSCDEFLTMGLRYHHLSPPSPDIDYIAIRLELIDSRSKNVHKTENAWIPVRITNGFPNQPPKASFMPMFILDVDQFILTSITTGTLDGEDSETPKSQLVFNITKAPQEGFITHLSDHTKPITSFTWADLNELLIAFQPPNNSHTDRRSYEVEFEVHDFYFRKSAPIVVHIAVRTTDTNAPRVSWNMGLNLLEGQSRPITWEQFQVVDNDDLTAVRLVTVDGLQHGRLTVRGGKGFMFTVNDIQAGVVRYHHDDSDTVNDFIIFRIFDGLHSTRHKFPIKILPKDDSPPFLINNVIFELCENQEVLIEKFMLQASDLDSSDDYILFKITKIPQAGEIMKRTAPGLTGYPISSFLQRDLFNAAIYYRHLGDEMFEDSFEVILYDSHDPPNLSEPQTVIIHITPVNNQLPKEAPGVIRHLIVKETEIALLTKNQLHFTDIESPNRQIVYTITNPPFFTSVNGLPDAGKLLLTDSMKKMMKDSSVPMLKSFTQDAVNHLKVAYMPPLQDIGPYQQQLQFHFSVSNQHGGTLYGLCFNVTILPVNNQVPELYTNQLTVKEGGSGQISVNHLLVTDIDTEDDHIKLILQKKPMHGEVEVNGFPITEGNMFTLTDLKDFKVRYQHDDSESTHDEVTFSATDGSNSARSVLEIKVLAVNDEPPEMRPGLNPVLYCLEGEDIVISTENIQATDVDSNNEKLLFMIAKEPLLGVVQKHSQIVDRFTQADIIAGVVKYVHTGGEVGLAPCFDTITLVVTDWDSGVLGGCCKETFISPLPLHESLPVYDLNITIMPTNNQPPGITLGELFIVDEGSSAAITINHLCASDPDTADDELSFVLWSPPEFGYIENTLPTPGHEKSNMGISIGSFDLKHMKELHINYVQSRHQRIEPTADQFFLYVTDGKHWSKEVPFYVIIRPVNDEAPNFLARNITVSEGQMCELDPSIINVVDLDVPADSLTFTVSRQPQHGMIRSMMQRNDVVIYQQPTLSGYELPVHDFTMDQLMHGLKLIYVHDGSESTADRFSIQLSDGKHKVHKAISVQILPVNDERPFLSRNNGLEVEMGDYRIISSIALEAEDKDTPRQNLYYVIGRVPELGTLQLKESMEWQPLYSGMNFSQDDIDMNQLRYVHTGVIGTKHEDAFHFHLSDGDNKSEGHSFHIIIRNIEKGEITVLIKPLTIVKGDRGTLTTTVLLASDGTNKPEELLYIITVPPDYGQIEYVNYPGVVITSFSQMDVAAQTVCYIHRSKVMATRDSLRFIVSNGLSSRNGTLEIIIQNTDGMLPRLSKNKGIRLAEGSMMTISPDVLQLSDPDTPPQDLTYIITQPPQYGQLYCNGAPLHHRNFTQLDVDNMDLAYKHGGEDSQIDRFMFTATDRSNYGFLIDEKLQNEPVIFMIEVDHVDKYAPKIVYLQCPSNVKVLKNGRYGIYISVRDLKASDIDSKDEELVFHILRGPHFGYLENITTGGFISDNFTQQDLNSKNIIYIITPSSEVTSDSLEFLVSDPTGNSAAPQMLEFKWSRTEMLVSEYQVCEDAGVFSVKVLRTGYLTESSFVGIKVNSITAAIGKDFTPNSANLIQLDPGVSVKSWNILITNDRLEENEETFELLLTSPVNTVLGAKTRALVKIIDAGGCSIANRGGEGNENPPIHALSGRMSQGSAILPNPKIGPFHVEENPVTYSHKELKQPQRDVSQEFPLKPVPKKKLTVIRHERTDYPTIAFGKRCTPVLRGLLYYDESEQKMIQCDGVSWKSWNPTYEEQDAKQCPFGWTLHNNHCYYLNTQHKATWTAAARACKEMHRGNLVSVITKQDMEWLWDFSGRRPFWIGLSDRIRPGKWDWAGGEQVLFTNWKRGSPPALRKKGKNCVLVKRRGKWQVKNCKRGKPHYYVCSIH